MFKGLSKRTARSCAALQSRGFTLIEIAVVLVIVGFLLAMIIGATATLIGQQRRDATRTRLTNIEAALAVFVSQNKRLPCPALGTRPSTDANAGLENAVAGPPISCAVNQQHGVVPWRALGISEQDATDGWGRRFTYRVAPDLVAANTMDFTPCDPGGTAAAAAGLCATGCNSAGSCTPPAAATATKGLVVRNLAAQVVMDPASNPSTGAAFVVISHGENGAGGYDSNGVLQAANGPASGTEEARNAANLVFVAATSYFVDDFQVYGAGTGHFDDFVLRPGILSVAEKARLGPRAHF